MFQVPEQSNYAYLKNKVSPGFGQKLVLDSHTNKVPHFEVSDFPHFEVLDFPILRC